MKQSDGGRKNTKKYKIVTDKLEKKYGLRNGMMFDGLKSIADANGVNTESIRLWKKKGYLIEI